MIAFNPLFDIVDILLFLAVAAIIGYLAGWVYYEIKNPLIVPDDYDMPAEHWKRYIKNRD